MTSAGLDSPKTADELAPPTPEIDHAAAGRAYDDDRAHVFHSWSAQGALKPMVVAAAQGSWLWDGEGNRYLDFSSQLVNTNIGHQHPKVVAAHPGPGGPAVHGRPAARQRHAQRGRAAHRRAGAGRHAEPRLLHQRRGRGDRERRPHGPAAHRAAQGAGPLPQLPRQHPDGDPPDRRPAALGQRLRGRGGRALLRPVPLPLGVPRHHRGGGVRARPRAPPAGREPRGSGRRSRPSCWRPSPAPRAS